MKHVFAPHLGHDVILGGRRRPKSYARRLKMKHVMGGVLPNAPSVTSYETAAKTALRKTLLNDQLGDCVIAGRGHRIGILTANAGASYVYTDDDARIEYERIGHYDPSDPSTDQGCVMSDAADDGVTVGYADGSKDEGWIDLDATDKLEVMQAIYLFEDVDLGMELPDAWLASIPSSDDFVWDVADDPNPDNGHDVQLVDYDTTKGARVATWGLIGWLSWAALAKYGARSVFGELIVHVNADQLDKAKSRAPNGYDWSTLEGFFRVMQG